MASGLQNAELTLHWFTRPSSKRDLDEVIYINSTLILQRMQAT